MNYSYKGDHGSPDSSQHWYEEALRRAGVMVFEQDDQLRYTRIFNPSPAFCVEDCTGKTDEQLMDPEDAQVLTRLKMEVLETGTPFTREVCITVQGHRKYYAMSVDPMRDPQGRITGVAGSFLDLTRQKQTERALRFERELLATIFDSIPVMISLYEPSINNLLFNRAFHQITGWTEDDIREHDPMELVYPDGDYRNEVADYMRSLTRGFKDIQMATKEGRIIETSWANIKMPDGRQVGIGVDITQRKQAERALLETQERFAAAFRVSPDALIITEAGTGEILDVNDAWTRLWGYTRQESIGRSTIELGMYCDPDDRSSILAIAREKGYVNNYELQLRHSNGKVRQALFSVELMQLSDRQLMLSVIEDVTQARQSEQERECLLEENRSQRIFMETLLENTKAGVAVVSGPELRFTMVNKAYQALRPDMPMVGRSYGEVFPGAVSAGAEDIVRQVVLTGLTHANTGYPMPIPGKRDATWDHHIVRLPLHEQQPPSALIITWDTTAHKRMTDKLAEANREMEAFSYSVSHDLRNPLLTIGSFTRFLQDDYSQHLDEEGRDYLRRIIQGANKMQQLIDDMLVLSRLGRRELNMETIDLTGAIHQCLEELQLQEPHRPLKATIQPGMKLKGDPHLIHLALENLLGNAWKYSKNKDLVAIEAGILQRDDDPVFFIRDHGEGFESQYARKIFEPFRRVHSDQEFPGSGVGLSIVARVIQRHNGRVWARSQPGEGATFYFVVGKEED